MAQPIWVRSDVVLAIHRRQIAEHGGAEGVRDEGLLKSALARPLHRFAYADDKPDMAELAAAYAFAIARNHPFVDGNKRTALVVFRTFLALNHCALNASQTEKYDIFLSLARGELTEAQLAAWIREHLAQS